MAKKMKRRMAAAAPVVVNAEYARNSLFPDYFGETLFEKERPQIDAAEAAWLAETKGW